MTDAIYGEHQYQKDTREAERFAKDMVGGKAWSVGLKAAWVNAVNAAFEVMDDKEAVFDTENVQPVGAMLEYLAEWFVNGSGGKPWVGLKKHPDFKPYATRPFMALDHGILSASTRAQGNWQALIESVTPNPSATEYVQNYLKGQRWVDLLEELNKKQLHMFADWKADEGTAWYPPTVKNRESMLRMLDRPALREMKDYFADEGDGPEGYDCTLPQVLGVLEPLLTEKYDRFGGTYPKLPIRLTSYASGTELDPGPETDVADQPIADGPTLEIRVKGDHTGADKTTVKLSSNTTPEQLKQVLHATWDYGNLSWPIKNNNLASDSLWFYSAPNHETGRSSNWLAGSFWIKKEGDGPASFHGASLEWPDGATFAFFDVGGLLEVSEAPPETAEEGFDYRTLYEIIAGVLGVITFARGWYSSKKKEEKYEQRHEETIQRMENQAARQNELLEALREQLPDDAQIAGQDSLGADAGSSVGDAGQAGGGSQSRGGGESGMELSDLSGRAGNSRGTKSPRIREASEATPGRESGDEDADEGASADGSIAEK